MSMIMLRADLLLDPRFARIVSITKANPKLILGCLAWLWSIGQTQSNGGLIGHMSFELVDEQCCPKFAEALHAVGWLEEAPDGVLIPDFDSYFGKSAKTREKNRLKKARQRYDKKDKDEEEGTDGGHKGDTRGTGGDKKGTPANTGSQRIPTDRIPTDSSGTHTNGFPPGGVRACVLPESGNDGCPSKVPQPPTGNAGAVAVATPPCPPSPSIGDVGRPGGSDATGGIVDEVSKHKQQAPHSSAERYLADRARASGQLPGFVAFYTEYNRKTGNRAMSQNKALLAWTANDLEADADTIIEGVRRWAECDQWRRGVVESAANFLADRQWERPPPTEVKDGPPDPEAAKATARAKADKMIREATEYAEEKARKKLEAAR